MFYPELTPERLAQIREEIPRGFTVTYPYDDPVHVRTEAERDAEMFAKTGGCVLRAATLVNGGNMHEKIDWRWHGHPGIAHENSTLLYNFL